MSLSATPDQATLDQLIRHARSFGTECVYETGEQEGLPSADLARLRIELDELEAGRKSKLGFSIGKRRRRSSDETRAAALALSVDGFVPEGDSRQARHLRPHGQELPQAVRSDGLRGRPGLGKSGLIFGSTRRQIWQ
jgi:hypothetical protein